MIGRIGRIGLGGLGDWVDWEGWGTDPEAPMQVVAEPGPGGSKNHRRDGKCSIKLLGPGTSLTASKMLIKQSQRD